jgi:hypothetical protein
LVQGFALVAIKILGDPSFDRGVIAERSNQLNYDSAREQFRTLLVQGFALVAIKILGGPSFDRGVIAERSNQLNYDSVCCNRIATRWA